jgi:glucose/arabinose dehydrogenase
MAPPRSSLARSRARSAGGVGGPPQQVQLARPHGVYVDRDGALLISDIENHRILRLPR